MQDDKNTKWQVQSETRKVVSFKRSCRVSSSLPLHPTQHSQRQPYLDEIATVQTPSIPSSWQKSREALFQLCTIPMSIYPKKLDTQQTFIIPVIERIEKKGRQHKFGSKSILFVLLLLLCVIGIVLLYSYIC